MRVLIACEYSGRVRDAFRARGHDAWSCDLLPTDADPAFHIRGDVLKVIDDGWDLMVAHPPCTYLANSGAKHLYVGMRKENGINLHRFEKMTEGAAFFKRLWTAGIPRIAVENPIMHRHAKAIIGSDQAQVIQPWQHGHEEMKATCLWLRGLPGLTPGNVVGPPPTNPVERRKWAVVHRQPPGPDRWKLRSTTFQGIADAMALQWSDDLKQEAS